ncbi:MAG TPA: hypothetical protein VF506_18415 [Streptosporangiaceae bacterium]
MGNLGKYAKTVVAVIGAAAAILTEYNVHAQWVPAVIALATALGVYGVTNKKPAAK